MATAEGTYPKVGGDPIYSSELNNYYYKGIREFYTGSDFDTSVSGSAPQTDEASYELTAIAASVLTNATYLKITIHYNYRSAFGTNETGHADLKAQIKEIGGSYSDIGEGYGSDSDTRTKTWSENTTSTGRSTWVIYHTLTAGEKANGFQVKLFSNCVITLNNASTSIKNRYAALEIY